MARIQDVQARIGRVERSILAWHRASETGKRLETVPGIGLVTATALAATATDPAAFNSGRRLAAWIGEKFHRWSDHDGDVWSAIPRDHGLADIALYWFTGAIGSSRTRCWNCRSKAVGARCARASSARC